MAKQQQPVAYTDETVEAVATYLRRLARHERPAGRFDRGGRFWLDERCDNRLGGACGAVRPPSRSWPYSQLKHGCTLTHICHALGADERAARQLARLALS